MRWFLPCLALLFAAPALANDPLEVAIDAVDAEAGADKDAALIIAIEDYAHVGDIDGAQANARLWRQWFNRRGTRNVKVIKNAAARHQWTKTGDAKGILAEVDAAAQRVKKGGTLWFVFIGHGAPLTSGNQAEGALLAQDVEQTADSIEARGIGIESDLLPRLAKAGKAVAVLDACFSGKSRAGKTLVPGLQPLVPVEKKAPGKVTVFTAAQDTEFAGPLPDKKRPAFTYLLLGALAGWADGELDRRKDKRVSAAEAHAYVETQLGELLNGRSQTPTLRGPDRSLTTAWATAARLKVEPPRVRPGTVLKQARWQRPTIKRTQRSGQYGLSIKHAVQVKGMNGRRTELSCYLSDAGGAMLRSPDTRFAAPNKQVAASQYVTPRSDDEAINTDLFIPEKELHLNPGMHRIKVFCQGFDSGKSIGRSTSTYASYTVAGKALKKKVIFSKGRLTHNHYQKGQKGLRIHHHLHVKGMKDRQLEVSCYFRFDDKQAKPLKDFNGRFKTPNGNIAVSEWVKLLYDDSNFADFKHFIPYDELHMGEGKTKLKVRCKAFDSGTSLGTSTWQTLTFTKPASKKSNAKAVFTKPRMVHNLRKDGKKGLGLRHHLQVKGMKDKRLEVTCYFYFKGSGKILKDFNGKYKTKGGDVSVADYVTPKYTDSTWKEFKHFIPYDELHITQKGKHKLKTRCEAFDAGRSIGIGPWQYLNFNK